MATLQRAQQFQLQRQFELLQAGAVRADRARLEAIQQAVENWFENARTTLPAAMAAAASPLVLSALEQQRLLSVYLRQKADRESGR